MHGLAEGVTRHLDTVAYRPARLEVIPHAGHWTYEEQPKIFDRIVGDYLEKLQP